MSSGGGGGSGTTRMEPPTYLQPHLERAAGASGALYGAGGPEQYPGNTVVPFSNQTEGALGAMEARARGGSPNVDAAQDLNLSTLQGDFLNGNPYLDSQIQRAVDFTRTNMDTQFAGAGRNLEAQLPARQEQVNNMVGDMLFRNYDAERGRQTGAIREAAPLANQDYFDIGQLANVGGVVEGQAGQYQGDATDRWNFEQNRPENAMDRYLGRLGVNSGGYGSQTDDTDRNRWLGAAGGALGGAGLASSLVGAGAMNSWNPWGWGMMGAGALLGGLG